MGFFFFFFLIPAQTNDSQYKDILLSEENIFTISNSKSWKRIINFDDENLAIERDKLYLSSQNDLDAKTELELTIKIYEDYLENKSDEICRFPARAFFVSHTFSDFPKFTAERCDDYLEWSQDNSIESISLMYVTGYLQNPASFFGHTLLKFNSSDQSRETDLLDSALNYGAETGNDPAVPYVFKGLTGLYFASLTQEKFFRLSAEYQEFQMRDIYEYRLNLSEYQKNLILGFSFEMIEKKYIYYFLSDNCAYRMNLILGLALGEDPMPNLPWAAPIDLLIGLNNTGAVSEISYHPSQTTKVISAISDLDNNEKKQFRNTFKDFDKNYNVLSDKTKYAVLENLNYLKLKNFKEGNQEELERIDEKRKAILLSLDDAEEFERKTIMNQGYPHEINYPTLIRYSSKKISDKDLIHSFRLRGANFEVLDKDKTRNGNSEFMFLSPKVSIYDGKVLFEELTLFKVLSLNDRKVRIEGESLFSWGIEASRKNLSDKCYPCSVNLAKGTIGKSFFVNEKTSLFSLANFQLHQSRKESGNISMSLNLGMISYVGKSKYLIEYEKKEFESNNIFDDESLKISIKFDNSFNRDYGISLKKSSDYEVLQLDLNFYF